MLRCFYSPYNFRRFRLILKRPNKLQIPTLTRSTPYFSSSRSQAEQLELKTRQDKTLAQAPVSVCGRLDRWNRGNHGRERLAIQDTNDDREQCNTFDQSRGDDHRGLDLVRHFRLAGHAFNSG